MLDLGANLTCDAENLVQFAILGCVYARVVMGVERPSVGLLNIGSEDVKGHDHLRDALSILNSISFQGDFRGFVEGDDIGKGSVDVVVTDGFTGNVALKTAEGFGALFSSTLKQEFSRSLFSKLAYLLALRPFNAVRRRLDHRVYNGGLFLGLNGVCIKSHGSADAVAFSHAVMTAHKMAANNFNPVVAREIEILASEETFLAVTNERASI
jgi:glycerol-3-phosphate acyltransferase PlsX